MTCLRKRTDMPFPDSIYSDGGRNMVLDCRELAAGVIRKLPFSLETELSSEDRGPDILNGTVIAEGCAENHAGFLSLKGSARLQGTFRCARCCKEFESTIVFPMEYKLASSRPEQSGEEDGADEYLLLEDGCLDLDRTVREQLLTEMPFRFLCREDCKGLCPVCGADRNVTECSCDLKERDPRWGALANFFEE